MNRIQAAVASQSHGDRPTCSLPRSREQTVSLSFAPWTVAAPADTSITWKNSADHLAGTPHRRHFRRWLRSAENPVLHAAVGLRRNSSRAGRSSDSFSAPARRFALRPCPLPGARHLPRDPRRRGPGDARGWRIVMLTFEHALAAAHRLAGFGDLIEVLSRRRVAASSSRLRGRSSAATRRPGLAGDPVASRCPGPGAQR